MLVELGINNFALIEKQNIEFSAGLNILTGETGAGKSILIGALELLLGARASHDFIRTGAEKAEIRALFVIEDIPRMKGVLEEMGLEQEEQLLLSREISRTGSNRTRINGQLATLAMIRKLSPFLIDIHGQYEHQSLFSPDNQRDFLDSFGGQELKKNKKNLARAYRDLQDKKKELQKLKRSEQERAQRLDLLRFQIKELEEAGLKDEEEEKLNAEHRILANAQLLHNGSQEIFSQLNGENIEMGITDQLGQMHRRLDELKKIDPQLKNAEELLRNSYYQLQELTREIRAYAEQIIFDENRLQEVENRIGEINNLKRKYGPDFSDVLNFLEKAREEYQTLEGAEEKTGELEKEISLAREEYRGIAEEVSRQRREAARKMADLLGGELQGLAMPSTRFEVNLRTVPDREGLQTEQGNIAFWEHGFDEIEFMLSPNPGEELKPLNRIASGGEISRLMLALKALTADQEQVPTMIFDEIDSGIGGKTAQKVAEKLDQISSRRQVITITHLPQIASMADRHLFIDKEVKEEKTRTRVEYLEEKEREKELARMLEGDFTETGLSHAREMLEKARVRKKNKSINQQ